MDFRENSERPLNWRGLTEHPVLADGQKVSLISKISGTMMESFTKNRGIHTSLSVHRSAPEYFDVRKNIKIHAFLPGVLSDAEIECLQMTKQFGGCLIVKGEFRYDQHGEYLGEVKASSYKTL